jgi:hypothetical protein
MTDQPTGRTTKQMLEAPRRAFYVWYSSAKAYPNALAKHLGREDLTIVAPAFFGYKGRGRGLKVNIVVDHACVLTVSQASEIMRCNLLKEEF